EGDSNLYPSITKICKKLNNIRMDPLNNITQPSTYCPTENGFLILA
ncbi:5527_t:CDS:2, partial [Gigaspora rosea]